MRDEYFMEILESEDRVAGNAVAQIANSDFSCELCQRFNKDSESCEAFPEVIPHDIFAGIFRHTKSMYGDRGLKFKRKG